MAQDPKNIKELHAETRDTLPAARTPSTEASLRVAYESTLVKLEALERELDGVYQSPSWRLGHRLIELGHRSTGAVLKGRFSEIRLPWTAPDSGRQGDDVDRLVLSLLAETWSSSSNLLIHVSPDTVPALQRWRDVGGRVIHIRETDVPQLAKRLQQDSLEHVALFRLDGRRIGHQALDAFPWSRLRPRVVVVDTTGRRTPAASLDEAAKRLAAAGYRSLRAARHTLVTPLTGLHRWWRLSEDGRSSSPPPPARGWLVACQRRSDFNEICGRTRAGD